jgi:hypothetical protein
MTRLSTEERAIEEASCRMNGCQAADLWNDILEARRALRDLTAWTTSGELDEAELQPDIAAAVEAFARKAEKEPLGVDVSDYGDEWVAGFLRGQVNALEEVGPVIAETMRSFVAAARAVLSENPKEGE